MIPTCPQGPHGVPPEAILDAHENPVLMVGSDYRIAAANRAYRLLLGEDEPIVGRCCYEVSHGRSEPCLDCRGSCPLRVARGRGQSLRTVHEHRTASGMQRFEIESRLVLAEGNGGEIGVLMVLDSPREAPRRTVPAALVGDARETLDLRELLMHVAPTDFPVLLVGELGTYRGSVALAIHRMSPRGWGAFDQVCPEESDLADPMCEIFGCWRRRPDGRPVRREGRIETCRGGTLLLRDIEAFPREVHLGLERLVTRGVFRAPGDREWSEADVRLIFSSSSERSGPGRGGYFGGSRGLDSATLRLDLPPLRSRLADLEKIVERLAEESPERISSQLTPGAWDLLRGYDFPGNLRELGSILARASLLAGGDEIAPVHLPEVAEAIARATPPIPPREGIVSLAEMQLRYLTWAERAFEGSRSDLAQALGIGERALYRRLERVRQREEASLAGFGTRRSQGRDEPPESCQP